MARKGLIETNKRRRAQVARFGEKRAHLKKKIRDSSVSSEERFALSLKLASMPRNSSPTRVRNRCSITGRPRAFYRDFGMSRIALREYASYGQMPGVTKSSW